MKRALIGLAAFGAMVAGSAMAQQAVSGESFETEVTRWAQESALDLREPNADEATIGGLACSGILIEALKADNLLQIFNPFTPVDYGSPEDKVVRDPITGRVVGLKFFSFRF